LAVTGLPFTIKETLAISTLYLVCVAAASPAPPHIGRASLKIN
jgi:hypothetical protein